MRIEPFASMTASEVKLRVWIVSDGYGRREEGPLFGRDELEAGELAVGLIVDDPLDLGLWFPDGSALLVSISRARRAHVEFLEWDVEGAVEVLRGGLCHLV